jgi:hypothetical protein
MRRISQWTSHPALQMRIQYKCLGPIYLFPEMKLLFPKQNYNVPCPYLYEIYIYIYIQDRSAYAAVGKYVDRSSWEYINRSQTHDVLIGTEAAQFPEKKYMNKIFVAMRGRNRHGTKNPRETISDTSVRDGSSRHPGRRAHTQYFNGTQA